jgi:NAD(P)-dependent dehydrogenase (short-subunit alcohol dehydrogenase family)
MTTVLVTGASRGIGAELCRQLIDRGCTVLAGARAPGAVPHGEPLALDVTQDESVAAAAREARARFGRVDVVINNAAILLDQGVSILDLSVACLQRTLDTNLAGALRVTQAFWNLLPAGGRIVNVSSMSGQLCGMDDWAPGYSLSKAALNALTVQFALLGQAKGLAVNAACPGWVRTDMGGEAAPRSVAEGAAGLVWLALDAPVTTTGGFFRDGQPIPW